MSEGEGKTKKARPYWVPFVVALAFFLSLVFIYFNPSLLGEAKHLSNFDMWLNIGYVVIVASFLVMFIWRITLSTEIAAEAGEEAGEVEKAELASEVDRERPAKKPAARKHVVVEEDIEEAEEETLPKKKVLKEKPLKGMPRMVEWPKKEPGGVYSDTLVRVDKNIVLNLRVLLGKVCSNCDELDDCKRRVAGKLDDDVFIYNFECKDGLKAELQKARKKREREKASEAKKKVKDLAKEKEEPKEKTSPKKKAAAKKKTGSKKKAAAKKKTGGKKKAGGKKKTGGKKKASKGKKSTSAKKSK